MLQFFSETTPNRIKELNHISTEHAATGSYKGGVQVYLSSGFLSLSERKIDIMSIDLILWHANFHQSFSNIFKKNIYI